MADPKIVTIDGVELVAAIKEQQALITQLQADVATLKALSA
jgi:hypothetical protein